MGVALAHWSRFDGWCAARNVDPLALSVERFCNLVYYWATRNLKPDDVEKFDAALAAPPSGDQPSEQVSHASGAWSRDAELALFKSGGG